MDHFRALIRAAPLKLVALRSIQDPAHYFRALIRAAPLKHAVVALHNHRLHRFPRVNSRGPIEAVEQKWGLGEIRTDSLQTRRHHTLQRLIHKPVVRLVGVRKNAGIGVQG